MTENLLNRLVILLFVLALVLFTTTTLYIAPLLLLSVAGIALTVLGRINLRAPAFRLLFVLFLLLWLPIVFSFPGAAVPGRVLEKLLAYACFLPLAILALHCVRGQQTIQVLFTAIFIVVTIWICDGTLQFFAGYNLFGYPYTPPQLKGMFFPKVRMPYFLAVLAPLYLEFIRLQFNRRKWLLLFLIPFGMVILLGGKRSAWVMLAFSGCGYLVYLYLLHQGVRFKKVLAVTAIIAVPLLLLIMTHAPLKDRVNSTLRIFTSDAVTIDLATAHRLDLWKVAVAIARDNWLTGVGPRGYRYVFNEYAGDDNFWIQAGYTDGTTHPHLQLLEIACETGGVGLFGYLAFYVLLLRLLLLEIRAGRLSSMPWLLCPLTAFFPLNAHLAFYGTYWSCAGWWSLSLALAVTCSRQHGENTDH